MGPVFYVKVLGRDSHTKGPRFRVPRKGLGSLVLSMAPRSQVEGPGSRVPPMGPDSRALLFRYALATLLKKRPWHRCFPVNFAKFLRTPVLQNTSARLLLCFMVFSDREFLPVQRFKNICYWKIDCGSKHYRLSKYFMKNLKWNSQSNFYI